MRDERTGEDRFLGTFSTPERCPCGKSIFDTAKRDAATGQIAHHYWTNGCCTISTEMMETDRGYVPMERKTQPHIPYEDP